MARKRLVDYTAELVVQRLVNTKDLSQFVRSISDSASWYGRFNKRNRILFTEKVIELIEKREVGVF